VSPVLRRVHDRSGIADGIDSSFVDRDHPFSFRDFRRAPLNRSRSALPPASLLLDRYSSTWRR
jgi:hypothetical protein